MADSLTTTTSVFGHRLLSRTSRTTRDGSHKHRQPEFCQLCSTSRFTTGQQQLVLFPNSFVTTGRLYPPRYAPPKVVRAVAAELTKEAYLPREDDRRIPRDWKYTGDAVTRLWPPSNKADDPSLHNPLLRQERMGCGWLGVIFEWEGVMVEDDSKLERQAWLGLSQQEGKPPPPAFVLKRIEGMKNEQAISEVLCWSRDPSEVRRLASRKEELLHRGGLHGQLRSGSQEFMGTLANHKIPAAVVSTRPKKQIEEAIEYVVGAKGSFDAVVGAEDVHRGKPDPEMFLYAAQQLNLIPERCIVFGNSNTTVEAAHDARMKCVAVASKHPLYELAAADMVVRRLSELSVVDLKNLADIESPEFGAVEPEVELDEEEEEEEQPSPSTSTSTVPTDDIFW